MPPVASCASAVSDDAPGLIVTFTPIAGDQTLRQIDQASSGETERLGRAPIAIVDSTGDARRDACAIQQLPGVQSVQEDLPVHALAQSTPWGVSMITAPSAWGLTTGVGTTVAVVDTGVDTVHPDLAARIWTNGKELAGNGIDDDGNGYVDDVTGWDFAYGDKTVNDAYGHGTHVAGTIAAADNAEGVIGVAPGARLMPVKVLDDSGSGYMSSVLRGFAYAAQNGARVANASLGGPTTFTSLQTLAATYPNTLFVIAAGNDGTNNDARSGQLCPNQSIPNLMCVAAMTSSGTLASFSTYGVTSVDLAAPGVSVPSTLPSTGSTLGTGYGSLSGTSMATPHVAGVAALAASVHPTFTGAQLRTLLRSTVTPTSGLTGKVASGGYVNATRVVKAAVITGTTSAQSASGTLTVSAPVELGAVSTVAMIAYSVNGGTITYTTPTAVAGSGPVSVSMPVTNAVYSVQLVLDAGGVRTSSPTMSLVGRSGAVNSGWATTWAGKALTQGTLDGTGTAARFNTPSGAAVAADGTTYIADRSASTIRRITTDGVVATIAGKAGFASRIDGTGSAARFNQPNGLAVDAAGNVYIADTANHAIRKMTPAGVVTTYAGALGIAGPGDGSCTNARFNRPLAVTVDRATGTLYVADSSAIRRISPSCAVTTIAGNTMLSGSVDAIGTNARLYMPTGITLLGSSALAFVDQAGTTVRTMNLSTGAVTTLGGAARSPGAINGTGAAARFNAAKGIVADSYGMLFVADAGNHALRRIDPTTRVVTTLSGQMGSAGAVDGAATSARFRGPEGLAIDAQDRVVVGDAGNATVRRVF